MLTYSLWTEPNGLIQMEIGLVMSKLVAGPMVARMHGEIHNLTGSVALILMAMAGQIQPLIGLP